MNTIEEYTDKFRKGKCPECGEQFKAVLPYKDDRGGSIKVCKRCDAYFRMLGGMVLKGEGATAEADRYYKEINRQNRSILDEIARRK